MDYNIHVSRRIRDLVAGGVITIGVDISRDGIDVWSRCTQPHPRLGIKTNVSLTLEEMEQKLEKVSLPSSLGKEVSPESPYKAPGLGSGFGKIAKVVAGPKVEQINDLSDAMARTTIGFQSRDEALRYSEEHNLGSIRKKKGGLLNSLPRDSLTPADFERPTFELYARACSVAESIGTPKITSRISSKPDVLRVVAATDLFEWWSKSTPTQRFIILTKMKAFPREADGVRIHKKWLDQLQKLPHPFRDAEAQVGQPEVELSAEDISSGEISPDENEEKGTLLAW